jgi:hypothetical protein
MESGLSFRKIMGSLAPGSVVELSALVDTVPGIFFLRLGYHFFFSLSFFFFSFLLLGGPASLGRRFSSFLLSTPLKMLFPFSLFLFLLAGPGLHWLLTDPNPNPDPYYMVLTPASPMATNQPTKQPEIPGPDYRWPWEVCVNHRKGDT